MGGVPGEQVSLLSACVSNQGVVSFKVLARIFIVVVKGKGNVTTKRTVSKLRKFLDQFSKTFGIQETHKYTQHFTEKQIQKKTTEVFAKDTYA